MNGRHTERRKDEPRSVEILHFERNPCSDVELPTFMNIVVSNVIIMLSYRVRYHN